MSRRLDGWLSGLHRRQPTLQDELKHAEMLFEEEQYDVTLRTERP